MAVSLYAGVPGSGKSYEVVRFVILPALVAGRRVVTNIAGLDEDACREFALERLSGVPGKLGCLLLVDDDEVGAGGFFPVVGSDAPAIVKAGDLVVIDEAWKFWGSDALISNEALDFFRKHRHFTHEETGVSCDLVVIAQEPSALHRKLRGVVELSFKARKAKTVGLNSVYSVHMFEGPNQRRRPFDKQTRRYDKEVFPLYSSYSAAGGAAGREVSVDGRQNVLKSWRVLVMFPAIIFLGVVGVYLGTVFFFPADASSPAVGSVVHERSANVAGVSEAAVPGSGTAVVRSEKGQRVVSQKPLISTEWRIAGYFRFSDRARVVIANRAGRLRYVVPGLFVFEDGRPMSGTVDGEVVTPWSGGLSAAIGGAVGASPSSIVPSIVGDVQ